jgi:hypothetical protein
LSFGEAPGVGSGALAAALAILIVPASMAALAARRRATISGVELALYWLGYSLTIYLLTRQLFHIKGWNWFPAGIGIYEREVQSAVLTASAIIVSSAIGLAAWRRAALGSVELALYWLGCCLALTLGTWFTLWGSSGQSTGGGMLIALSCLIGLDGAAGDRFAQIADEQSGAIDHNRSFDS